LSGSALKPYETDSVLTQVFLKNKNYGNRLCFAKYLVLHLRYKRIRNAYGQIIFFWDLKMDQKDHRELASFILPFIHLFVLNVTPKRFCTLSFYAV
jgi:hypothetical protein